MNDSLNGLDIKALFLPHIYRRGLAYYKENRVEGLSFNRNNQSWFAYVQGTESYYVDINLDKLEDGMLRSYCECPAFTTYHSCKHVVAVLLAIQKESSKQVKTNRHVTTHFMDEVARWQIGMQQNHLEQTPMDVVYEIEINRERKVHVQLKTGIEHRYVVQDVREFLEAVLAHQPYTFTKKFTFDPKLHFFLQKDLAIFRALHTIIQTGDIYTQHLYVDTQHRYDKRHVLIPSLALKDICMQLKERQTAVVVNNKTFDHVEVVESELPVSYTVSTDEEEEKTEDLLLEINYSSEDVLLLDLYDAVIADNTFYFPEPFQLALLRQTLSQRIKFDAIPIEREKQDLFFTEIIPTLKKTSEVKIAEHIANDIVEYPLRAELYVEETGDYMTGKLQYHYGPHVVDPFAGNEHSSVIIIRDTEKEAQIMNLIEEANFRYNGKHLYLTLDEDEDIYEFLYRILPALDEYVALYLSAPIQQMIFHNDVEPTTSVKIDAHSNLLEIGFDVTGVMDEEIDALLGAIMEKKRFYRLRSGAMMSLEDAAYESIHQLFADMGLSQTDIHDAHVQIPAYRGMQLDELLQTKKSYDHTFRKLLSNLRKPEEQMYEIPANLQADLRSYQKVGYQWFKSLSTYHLGGILADDMGLGKTLQTISYLLSEKKEHPHLIVVPSSVVYNWQNECAKFAPSLTVTVIQGTKEERKALIEGNANADIWITSYGTIRQDIELYQDLMFQTLILDEAQFIKNYATKTAKAVRTITASRKFALSGTPIENSLDELWSIFQVVLPGLLPSLREFRQLDVQKISTLTRPFILRRLKEDVLKELPEKIESVHVSELSNEEKQLYVAYLKQIQSETSEQLKQGSFQQNRMKILAGLTRLRQLCCHPSLFLENYTGQSSKLETLLNTMETFIAEGKRMLVFSQFTSMHEIIIAELQKRGIDYFYLHGQTDAKSRVEMSEAFNQGEKNVFLISLRAGGTGLNLTGADTVILYDLWWNPAVEDQAAGRAHRFGQKKVVQVIRLLTEGTIEEKIYELQQKKRELIDQVVQPGETMLASLSEDDIREILNIT